MIVGPWFAIILFASGAFALNPQEVTNFLEGLSSTQPRSEKYTNVVYTTTTSTTPRNGRVAYVQTPSNERVTYVSSTTPSANNRVPYYTTSAPKSQRVIYDAPRSQDVRLYTSTAAPRRYTGSLYSTSARQVTVPNVEVVSSTSASPLNINPRATIQVPYVSQRQEIQAHIPSDQESAVEEVIESEPEPVEIEKKINIVTPAVKKTIYEIRKPAIEKQFFDIEEKVVVRPAGTAVVELEGSGTQVKKEETIQDIGKEQIVPSQTPDCETSYVSTPGPVVAYNGESGVSTVATDYVDNKEDYVDYNDPRYVDPLKDYVEPAYFGKQTQYAQSSRLTEPEQIYNDLLSNRNSVSVNDGPTSPGERVISATPASVESKPASQTVQTRRIVVNHPFETVQLVEQNEPQEKVQAVTITQKVEPARYRASNLRTTSRLIQAPTVVPVRVVEAPKATVLPVRIVETPKPTVVPVRIVESPRPTVLPVRIVEAPKRVIPVRIVEAQKSVVPVRIVEAPKPTVLPVRIVQAPRTVVPVRVTAQPVQLLSRYATVSPKLITQYPSAALTSGYYGSSYPYSSALTSGYGSNSYPYSSALTSGYYGSSSPYSSALTSGYYGSSYPYSSALTSGYSGSSYPYSSALTSGYSGSSYPYSSALTSGYYGGGYSSGSYGGYASAALTSGYGGGYSSAALTADDCVGDGIYK